MAPLPDSPSPSTGMPASWSTSAPEYSSAMPAVARWTADWRLGGPAPSRPGKRSAPARRSPGPQRHRLKDDPGVPCVQPRGRAPMKTPLASAQSSATRGPHCGRYPAARANATARTPLPPASLPARGMPIRRPSQPASGASATKIPPALDAETAISSPTHRAADPIVGGSSARAAPTRAAADAARQAGTLRKGLPRRGDATTGITILACGHEAPEPSPSGQTSHRTQL